MLLLMHSLTGCTVPDEAIEPEEEGTILCRSRNCGRRLYVQPQFVRDYIAKYGERKCEANALVVAPQQGRQLAEDAIVKYLGHDSISRFKAKRQK
jgi:hypothetical protein